MCKLMEYKFIYRLMPKWSRFIYTFNIMAKNEFGRLFLGNGYCLNFGTMTIEDMTKDIED